MRSREDAGEIFSASTISWTIIENDDLHITLFKGKSGPLVWTEQPEVVILGVTQNIAVSGNENRMERIFRVDFPLFRWGRFSRGLFQRILLCQGRRSRPFG